MSAPSPAPGTPEYYRAQIEDSRRRAEQRKTVQAGQSYETTTETGELVIATPQVDLSKADVQQRNYAAYQEINREKQAEALRTSKSQSISHQEVEAKRTAMIEAEVRRTGGIFDYSDVQEARRQAQAANYAEYQLQNISGQREALQYGAADFGAGAPVKGRPGVIEEVGPGGNLGYTIVRQEQVNPARQVLIQRAAQRRREIEAAKIHEEMRAQGYGGSQLSIDDEGNWTFHFIKSASAPASRDEQAALYYDPTNPWNVSDRPPEEAQISAQIMPLRPRDDHDNVPDDPISGFGNYFANIPKGFQKGIEDRMYGKSDVTVAPEVEGDIIGAIVKAGQDTIVGRPSTFSEDIAGVRQLIEEKPLYAAGSIGASVAFTIATIGAGPVIKAAQTTAKAARVARNAEVIGKTAAEMAGMESTGVRAAKVTRAGDVVAMERGPLGMTMAKKSVTAPAFGDALKKVDVPGTDVSFALKKLNLKGRQSFNVPSQPDIYVIEQGTDDIGMISTKTGKAAVSREPLSLGETEQLVGQKVVPSKSLQKPGEGVDIAKPGVETMPRSPDKPVRAESVVEVRQDEASVLKTIGSTVRKEGEKMAADPVKDIKFKLKKKGGRTVASAQAVHTEKVPVGSVIVFKDKDLLAAANAADKRAAQASAARKALESIPGEKRGAQQPFEFKSGKGPAKKTSNSPLEIISTYESDRALREASQATKATMLGEVMPSAKSSGAGARAVSVGALAASAGGKASLGFGGATGEERKAAAKAAETDVEIVSTQTPPGFDIEAKPAKVSGSASSSATRVREKIELVPTQPIAEKVRAKEKVNLLETTREKPSSNSAIAVITGQQTGQGSRPATDSSQILKESAAAVTRSGQRTERITRQTPFTVPKQRPITIPKPIPRTPPGTGILRFPGGGHKGTRRKSKPFEGFTKVTGLGVKNILAPGLSIEKEGGKIKRPAKTKGKKLRGKRR